MDNCRCDCWQPLAVGTVLAQTTASSSAPTNSGISPPFSVCSKNVNILSLLPGGAHEDHDVAGRGFHDFTRSKCNVVASIHVS